MTHKRPRTNRRKRARQRRAAAARRGVAAAGLSNDGAAGLDLLAALDVQRPMTLAPGARALVPTG